MTRIPYTAAAMLFGALVMPAAAQQSDMQPATPSQFPPAQTPTGQLADPASPGMPQSGGQRSDMPAAAAPTPVSPRMQDGATTREAPGAMGATTPPDSRTVARAKRNPDNNNSQDPVDAEARGNGQAPTGADANQPARSTQMPGQQGAQPER